MRSIWLSLMFALGVAATAAGEQRPVPPMIPPLPVQVVSELEAGQRDQPPFIPNIPPAANRFPRGLKKASPEVLARRHAEAFIRHGHRLKSLPTATPATFDCKALGWVGEVQDQGQCGSCWLVATCDVATNAYIKAGLAKGDGSWHLSPQYGLDGCAGPNGGCNGDDAPTPLDWLKNKGMPTTQDYGPYTASSGRCRYNGQKLYKIKDWAFCKADQSQGVASTQEIKNAIVAFGEVTTDIAAQSDWDNYRPGTVMPFRRLTPGDVDHVVGITGWDDSKAVPGTSAKGAFLVRNQWSKQWGDAGECWIGYGSHQIGTEAAAVILDAPVPPPPVPPGPVPPGPVPPGPTPPVPPTPGGFTGSVTYVYAGGVLAKITTTAGVADGLQAELEQAGISPMLIVDVLKLLTDIKSKAGKDVIFADLMKILMDFTAAEPAPPTQMPAAPRGLVPVKGEVVEFSGSVGWSVLSLILADQSSYYLDGSQLTYNGSSVTPAKLVGNLMAAKGRVTVILHPRVDRYGLSTQAEFLETIRPAPPNAMPALPRGVVPEFALAF